MYQNFEFHKKIQRWNIFFKTFIVFKILHKYINIGCDDVCFRSDRDDDLGDRLFYDDRDSDIDLLGDDHCDDLDHSFVGVLGESLGEEFLRFVL